MEKKKINIILILLLTICVGFLNCNSKIQIEEIILKNDYCNYLQEFKNELDNNSPFISQELIKYDSSKMFSIKNILQICEKEYEMINQGIFIDFKTKSIIGGYFIFEYNSDYEFELSFCLDSTNAIQSENNNELTLKDKLELLLNSYNFKLYQFLVHKPYFIPEAENPISIDSLN